jgi:hypothetical protein
MRQIPLAQGQVGCVVVVVVVVACSDDKDGSRVNGSAA